VTGDVQPGRIDRTRSAPTQRRAQRAEALERWADHLVEAKTAALRTIAELVEQRDDVDTALLDAIRDARTADRSWSEIGAMLGVSKQAAQPK
jgi:ABC-type transporter Mla subunit MlaD